MGLFVDLDELQEEDELKLKSILKWHESLLQRFWINLPEAIKNYNGDEIKEGTKIAIKSIF